MGSSAADSGRQNNNVQDRMAAAKTFDVMFDPMRIRTILFPILVFLAMLFGICNPVQASHLPLLGWRDPTLPDDTWIKRCRNNRRGFDPFCEVVRSVRSPSGDIVFSVRASYGSTLGVPQGLRVLFLVHRDLEGGVEFPILVDGNKVAAERLKTCFGFACIVQLQSTPSLQDVLRTGKMLTLHAKTDDGDRDFTISLDGFRQAVASRGIIEPKKTQAQKDECLRECLFAICRINPDGSCATCADCD